MELPILHSEEGEDIFASTLNPVIIDLKKNQLNLVARSILNLVHDREASLLCLTSACDGSARFSDSEIQWIIASF